jgi:hypothetical protein
VSTIETAVVHRSVNPARRHSIYPGFAVQANNLILDRSDEAILQASFTGGILRVARLTVYRRLRPGNHNAEVLQFLAVLLLPCFSGLEEVLEREKSA